MPENRDAEGRFLPGASGNPGGRPKRLREIEEMLDAEFRTVERVRAVFERLRYLALYSSDVQAIKLYLDRVLGPMRPLREDEEIDLSDAPPPVLEWLRENGIGQPGRTRGSAP